MKIIRKEKEQVRDSKKALIIRILQTGTVEQLDNIRYMLNGAEIEFIDKMLLQIDLMDEKKEELKYNKGVRLC